MVYLLLSFLPIAPTTPKPNCQDKRDKYKPAAFICKSQEPN